jgi:hypothetical protein
MRTKFLDLVIVLAALLVLGTLLSGRAHAQELQTANPGVSAHPDGTIPSPAPQALTDAERCSVDSLAQRATIVALRAELAKLQARLAELEAPIVDQAVQRERAALEQRFRDRLKPPANHVFDWQTLTFTAPKAPAKEPQQ